MNTDENRYSTAVRVAVCLSVSICLQLWLLLPAAAGVPPSGGGEPEWFAGLEAALASKAEACGDRRKAVEEWLAALERHADTPAAEVLLLRIAEMDPFDVEQRTSTAVYERLLRGRRRLSGRARELVTDRLARRYRIAGSFGRAEALEREMGYVNRWIVAGPFGYTRWAVHDQVFPPESEIDLEQAMRSGHSEVRWRLFESPVSGRRIDLFTPLWPREGAAYAVAQARSDGDREAFLTMRCAGPHKAWWNGRLVLDADRGREVLPRETVRPVSLRTGWNRLLVKVAAAGSVVSVRLADGEGLPLDGVEWEGRFTLHELARGEEESPPGGTPDEASDAAGVAPRRGRTPTAGRGRGKAAGPGDGTRSPARGPRRARSSRASLRDFVERKELKPGKRSALLLGALAVVSREDGRAEAALSLFDAAVKLAPESPHLWYQLGLTAESADVLPPSMRRTRAREAYERAAAARPGHSAEAGVPVTGAVKAGSPPESEGSRAAEAGAEAAALEPRACFVPADEAIASQLRRDRHPERAIARLRDAEERLAKAGEPGGSPHVRLALAEIALEQGWTHEARAWAQDAEKAGPRWRPVHLFWTRFHLEHDNVRDAAAACREAIALDRSDPRPREALARICMNLGEYNDAVSALRKALEADPARLEGYLALARAELDASIRTVRRRGRLPASPPARPQVGRGGPDGGRAGLPDADRARLASCENTLRAGLRLCPAEPSLRRMLGELALMRGEPDEALAEWDKALDQDRSPAQPAPGQPVSGTEGVAGRPRRSRTDLHELRRQRDALAAARAGEDDDFSRPFAIDVWKAVSEAKGPADYPQSDTILVVDQTVDRICEDGSYSEITHVASKALTAEGAEKLSRVTVAGELLEARTHLPDGDILEPAVLPGSDELTMPGVAIGAVVEYRYRRDHPAPTGGFVSLPPWYFRSLDRPHQLSDYVVIAPESMDLCVVTRNWGAKSPAESFVEHPAVREGGLVTRRWTAKDARPLDAGAGHDHESTFLPHVVIGRPRTWEDVNREILDRYLGRTRLTEAIREEAANALRDSPGDFEGRSRALFRHVNRLVKSDAEIYEANHILKARAGSRAILLVALMRAAGLDARFAAARPRAEAVDPAGGPGEPVWALPSAALFDDTFVRVASRPSSRPDGPDAEPGGAEGAAAPGGEPAEVKQFWLDPEGPYSPFGKLPPRYHGGTAYVVSREGGELTNLPWGSLREHGRTVRTRIVADPEALALRGVHEIVFSGTAGGAYKKRFAESASSSRKTWAEKRLGDCLAGWGSGARLEDLELAGLDDPEAPLTVRSSFVIEDVWEGTEAGGERGEGAAPSWLVLPTALEPVDMTGRFAHQAKRAYALKIHEPLVRTDRVDVVVGRTTATGAGPGARPPAEVADVRGADRLVRSWAPPASRAWQTAFGSYNLAFTWRGDRLRIRRSVTVVPQVVEPGRYEEFVRFCRRVDAAEAAPLRVRLARGAAAGSR